MSALVGVHAGEIDAWWPDLLPWVGRALAAGEGEYGLEDVRRLTIERAIQLWAFTDQGSIEGMAATQVINYPRARKTQIFLGAARDGLSDRWMPWLEGIEGWARVAQEASANQIIGRPGWVRRLSRFGYRQTHVVMQKDLR